MGLILEIRNGPMTGKVIGLRTGESITVGRAAGRAQFALPHDTFMSGEHFAFECGPSGSRVVDRKSSNGTFLNGARIQHAMLANGDEIKAGQTIFAVKIVADAKLASLMPPEEVAPPPQGIAPPPTPPQRRRPAEPTPRAEEPSSPPPPRSGWPVEQPKGAPANSQEPSPGSDAREAARVESVPEIASEPPAIPTSELDRHVAPSRPAVVEPPRAAEDSASGRAKQLPQSVPPPGVAPHIAEKFRDLPAARGVMGPGGAAFAVMGWSFPAAPADWQIQEGFGLQQSGHEEFPGSVAASEEILGGITLQQFVESQISTLRGYLRDPKIEPTMPPRVGGADESMAVDVRHSTKDGRELVYRRIYARSGSSVGVLTVTTLAADFPQVLQSLQPLLEGAAFHSTVNS
ncbi:MAG TPA: FHA domain-containing protein [Candidatus Acidoferrum sp.]|nr:FHA domain-containing protein [Candidatus Acidoferrum sp.]